MAFGPRWIWNHSQNLFGLGTIDVESNSVSDIDITQEKTTTHPLPQVKPLIHRMAVVGLGLGVTCVWICFLGYGFVRLMELLI
jgi:hypothetical protein